MRGLWCGLKCGVWWHDIAMRVLITLFLALALLQSADAGEKRSAAARAEFVRMNHCPATGKPRGACPGWVVDHVVALACGGADHPSNMQWQTVEDAKAKDKVERKGCQHSAVK